MRVIQKIRRRPFTIIGILLGMVFFGLFFMQQRVTNKRVTELTREITTIRQDFGICAKLNRNQCSAKIMVTPEGMRIIDQRSRRVALDKAINQLFRIQVRVSRLEKTQNKVRNTFIVGTKGPRGFTGRIGMRGPRGFTGRQGPQGERGPRGRNGIDGTVEQISQESIMQIQESIADLQKSSADLQNQINSLRSVVCTVNLPTVRVLC